MSITDKIRVMIEDSNLDPSVLGILVPDGKPFDYETDVWDYKLKLPALLGKSQDQTNEFNCEIAELIKDVVAFHNAYGGYLIFGISSAGDSRVIGADGALDTGDFNKRIEAATGSSIECRICYASLGIDHDQPRIPILFIPRRLDHVDPVVFRKNGPQNRSGDRAYKVNDVYVRRRDECRPATATSADWRFLHGSRGLEDREAASATGVRSIDVKLPARDPDLVKFVGREEYLARLRSWLADRRSYQATERNRGVRKDRNCL